MRITNTQKKELSDIFRKKGLNVLDFETSGQYKEFKIKFKHEYFSFSINIVKADTYNTTILPINNTKGFTITGTWLIVTEQFELWAGQISSELNTPTGWESFQSENFLNADIDDLNQKFTDIEKNQIRYSINELKQRIKTLEISQDAIQVIDKKLDNLGLSVDELNKFDWKSLFIGSIASLIMTLSIPSEASGLLWEFIKIAFSGLKLKG